MAVPTPWLMLIWSPCMQVSAGERLAQRLLSTPMLATMLLHDHARRPGLPSQPVPVGTAEVDLSGLLLPR